jgi:indole-3-glycerol phosphate synthase
MTILDKIIEFKRMELENKISIMPASELEKSVFFGRGVNSLSKSLLDRRRTGIIAEFKRKSPSKGIINDSASPKVVSDGYYQAGASAVSVLTESEFFGGSVEDLLEARQNSKIPILRKDFIIDEYQVIEAKSIGADAILLIAAALNKEQLLILAKLADSLGLEVIMEVHNLTELEKYNKYINIIGVNNRDLKTFKVDTDISVQLAENIPSGVVKISESGISDPSEIMKLKKNGYEGFFMGERFMAEKDPTKAFREFISKLNQL